MEVIQTRSGQCGTPDPPPPVVVTDGTALRVLEEPGLLFSLFHGRHVFPKQLGAPSSFMFHTAAEGPERATLTDWSTDDLEIGLHG